MGDKLSARCAKVREESGRSSRPDRSEIARRSKSYKKSNYEKANAARRAATHCKHGHELIGENLKVTAKGERKCITCRNIFNRSRRFVNDRFLRAPAKADVGIVTSISAPAPQLRNDVMLKNEGLAHDEWMRLYGFKQKRRILVDAASGSDDERD